MLLKTVIKIACLFYGIPGNYAFATYKTLKLTVHEKTVLLLTIVLVCVTKLTGQQLTIGSYNIRYINPDDVAAGNGWEQRLPIISQLINFNDFDILGAQEVLRPQLNDLLAQLPAYDYTGVGRDDRKTEGEYAPVFYRKDKVTLLRSGHFWLSEQTAYPNKGWDAVLPRICTWAEFEVKKTGLTLWFFNLHMDHIGVEARRQSALLVLRKIEEMCGEAPVILTGDFNVDQTSESYLVFANSGTLVDSYETTAVRYAVRYAVNGTFNNFEPNRKDDSRIDHIFVSPTFRVERYRILTDMYWEPSVGQEAGPYSVRIPSDHYPVKVTLSYPN